jgi:hypothetical protein
LIGPTANLSFNPQAGFHHTSTISRNIANPRPLAHLIFVIHYLRKERLYAKLKYSRCPQYDIVSGGFAALFAGFIGFLISEKFGIELVDSGDFYNALMYVVFACFPLMPLIRCYSRDNTPYLPFSPKYFFTFTRDILVLLVRVAAQPLPILFDRTKTFLNKIYNFLTTRQLLAAVACIFSRRK